MKDHRDIAEQTVTGHVSHILSAYCDLAAVHIIETGNQVANRGFAAARWPYNGRSAALRDGKADIPQNRNFIVGECHITESNVCVLQRNIFPVFVYNVGVFNAVQFIQRSVNDLNTWAALFMASTLPKIIKENISSMSMVGSSILPL